MPFLLLSYCRCRPSRNVDFDLTLPPIADVAPSAKVDFDLTAHCFQLLRVFSWSRTSVPPVQPCLLQGLHRSGAPICGSGRTLTGLLGGGYSKTSLFGGAPPPPLEHVLPNSTARIFSSKYFSVDKLLAFQQGSLHTVRRTLQFLIREMCFVR